MASGGGDVVTGDVVTIASQWRCGDDRFAVEMW
jgi:hypothetical protein